VRRLTLSVLSLAFLAACQPATTELTEEQKAALADSAIAVNTEAWQPWLAADVDQRMQSLLNSPDVGWAWNGEIRFGHANIAAWFRPFLDGVASQEFTVTERRAVVLSRDVVCVMESGTIAATDTAGVTFPPSAFAFTAIWVRREGEWKIHLGHESSRAPESM
jgi:uncharacterized protein (TIGR02246 family)